MAAKSCRHCAGTGSVLYLKAASNPVKAKLVGPHASLNVRTITVNDRVAADDLDAADVVGLLARGELIESD